MSYVVYRVSDSKIMMNSKTRKEYYETEAAAKAARTRLLTKLFNDGSAGMECFDADYGVAELSYYRDNIEQMVTVRNLMSGKEVEISVNTPSSCDPSTETYWCM